MRTPVVATLATAVPAAPQLGGSIEFESIDVELAFVSGIG